MSTRRVPLGANPNAVNSPMRTTATSNVGKHQAKRSIAIVQQEDNYTAPPAKKHIIEAKVDRILRTPPRQTAANTLDGQLGRRAHAQSNVFDRKLEAARRRPSQAQARADRQADKAAEENLETIRQWQKHYRKVFPRFVFYFESVPEDSRARFAKQVTSLGAREEKFFSNAVTHVVTTRSIPAETTSVSPTESGADNGDSQTINPSLLDRTADAAAKGRSLLDATFRKASAIANDNENRRVTSRNADVLHRARELGMKIWAVEKLQRMMTTMFDTDTGVTHSHNTRSNSVQAATVSRSAREADLSALLRNERVNGPSDRDPTVATKEMIIFKGPYIYVHDMDERQKPIMVREYQKVIQKEAGDWPQFRSVAQGKCPFVPEPESSRKEAEREALRQQRRREEERLKEERLKRDTVAARTRAALAAGETSMQPPARRVLGDSESALNAGTGSAAVSGAASNSFSAAQEDDSSSRAQPMVYVKRNVPPPRMFAGEPVASGLQKSNITSAIQSAMISSTSAAPGAKAGTSKEVHGLQRKVLEKNSAPIPTMTSSRVFKDLSALTSRDMNGRLKRKGTPIEEASEEPVKNVERQERQMKALKKSSVATVQKVRRRDPKPGYCENCMDKFDDFDEHILSRKHRRFAEKHENWRDLDALIRQLNRPLREELKTWPH